MTYDKNGENSSASGSTDHQHGPYGGPFGRQGGPFGPNDGAGPGWDRWSWATRPGFHPLKALTVLGGFALAPPLGVLALGYFLWNSRHSFGHHYGPGPSAEQFAGGPGMSSGMGRGRCGGGYRGMRRWSSGNEAFDRHARETMEKLRDERRAFFEYRANERAKRDQQAYDAFRAAQDGAASSKDGDLPQK